jgi:acyl-CoA thioester hydrolase
MEALPEGFSTPGTGGAPITIEQPVAWGEMDSLGHVNNAVYLTYLENVRFAYFDAIGLNAWHAQHQQGPILARVELDFLAPLAFPDRLLLSTRVQRLGTKSFTLHNLIWSTGSRTLAARADAVIVMMDYANEAGPKTIAIPGPIRAAIERLDGLG